MNDANGTRRSLEPKLAVGALLLAVGALFGQPAPGDEVTINVRELALLVESKVDHVTVQELADWIIEGRTDYRLIDVRDEAEAYAGYHIPTAEHVRMHELADYPLYRNEKIVLYSDGGIHSAQAWFLLRARGYDGTYILYDGMNAWKDDVLFPVLAENASPAEIAGFESFRRISEFFGGRPMTGGVELTDGEALPMPAVEMSTVVVAPRNRKKPREGC